jgi:RNA polymerase sigma-32 factor
MRRPNPETTGQKKPRGRRNRDQLPAIKSSGTELAIADELTQYLNEVRRYPLLDKERESALAKEYYEEESLIAAQRLVTGNLRLVVKIAMEYKRTWVNVMDLIQEGNIGLAEAVKRFDPYRGVRFSSFARYWIRALILQFILKNFRMISFANTRAGRKLFFRLEKERNRLMQLYGEATTEQLALALDVSEADVEAATILRQPTLSLDAPRFNDEGEGGTWGESIEDRGINLESDVVDVDFNSIVKGHMDAFGSEINDPRERVIWEDRLLSEDPQSLSVLGERFQVSRERVRQLEHRLKKRLKGYLSEQMGGELSFDIDVE